MTKPKFRGHRCDPCIAGHRPCDGVRPVCGTCENRNDGTECQYSHDQPPPDHLRRKPDARRHDRPRRQESASDNDDSTASDEDLSMDEGDLTSAPLSDAQPDSSPQWPLPLSGSFTQPNEGTLQSQDSEAPQPAAHHNPSEERSPLNTMAENLPNQSRAHGAQQATPMQTRARRESLDDQPTPNTYQSQRGPPAPAGGESSGTARLNAIDLTATTGMGRANTQPTYANQSEPFRSTITPASVRSGELPADGIVIPNVDRGLAQYLNQTTSHLTVEPTNSLWGYRQSRVVVIGPGQIQMNWEYPFRPVPLLIPMTDDEARPYLFDPSGRRLLGGTPVADPDILGYQLVADNDDEEVAPTGNTGVIVAADNTDQQQESSNNGGNTGAVEENAEDPDAWMDQWVDWDGNAN
ncbi:hypothetical protein H2200_006818 [Cladophialophora chaetospira]|uniref:Zn(2)-C6 fungal-type domain-containing protein n=1 Tax=Cladophialophora chaetospira TaxID=386627 RepID=A0AA38X9I5_9EURO|nr:hypothetical protein H2200_006818 [Cladophialophora chaetospira]